MLARRLQLQIAERKSKNLLRQRRSVCLLPEGRIQIDKQICINFSSSDYLALSKHPALLKGTQLAIETYGTGSTASAMISGYSLVHQNCEQQFAEFLQRDRAILFSSGYQANIGVLSALADASTAVFFDRLAHASMIDGIQLARAKHYRFHHQDYQHLQQRLASCTQTEKLVLSESVFSMDGDKLNSEALLAQTNQAEVILDEAHAIGVLGHRGGGLCEQDNLTQSQVPLVVVPLGKAFAGSGAIVAGDKDWIEAVLQFARSYTYSTAPPPVVAASPLAALTIVKDEAWRREKLHTLNDFFITEAKRLGLKLASHDNTPIHGVLIGDDRRVGEVQQSLLSKGFFVAAIRPPTVPKNTARLRISLTCYHDEAQISQLLAAVAACLCETDCHA